jgi:pimeloyl-ACP methyl ester carboxylesterase
MVEIATGEGRTVRGWYGGGAAAQGAVLFLHGVREDRRTMLGRAELVREGGFSVLLIDLQAHGESAGERITLGVLESHDAAAAVAWLRERHPGETVAAVGFSLGGAACLLGDEPLAVDALVLEGVYVDIESAIANRLELRLGRLGGWLTPLLTGQIPLRLDVPVSRLRPIDAIASVRAPVLVVGGERDERTKPADTRALFAAAPQPKKLWIVPGAGHGDYRVAAPAEYERRVLGFLTQAMDGEE